MRRSSFLLLSYIVVLQILDGITTFLALRSGALELNPLIRMLGDDPVRLMVFKALVGLGIYLLISDEAVMKYQKVVLLPIYTIFMLQAIITNIVNVMAS